MFLSISKEFVCPFITGSCSSQCPTTGVTKVVVYGMVHIKEPLLLIGKSSPCSGGSGFSLLLSELSFTICPMPYNCIKMC